MALNIMENAMTPKAEKSPTTTRRQILVAAPAALVASNVPAMAASGVTPELAKLFSEFQRLNAIIRSMPSSGPGQAYDENDECHPIEEAIMTFPASPGIR
jgi:hypothetical protein